MPARILLLAALTVTLAACQRDAQPAAANKTAANARQFVSKKYGFQLNYPPDFKLQHNFKSSYLQNGSWKLYAPAGSFGRPVLALVLNGSNAITDAELRIGTSRNLLAVSRCKRPPAAARGQAAQRNVNGTSFTYFQAADAAMSHYLQARSYRAVVGDACIAVDLLIFGSNPQVYAPPATPPFTHAQAWQRLQAALQGLHFGQ